MATQKQCESYLKEWMGAEEITEAIKYARLTAEEYDGLYEESAVNLLARSPDLMLCLSAFEAGRQAAGRVHVAEGTLL